MAAAKATARLMPSLGVRASKLVYPTGDKSFSVKQSFPAGFTAEEADPFLMYVSCFEHSQAHWPCSLHSSSEDALIMKCQQHSFQFASLHRLLMRRIMIVSDTFSSFLVV